MNRWIHAIQIISMNFHETLLFSMDFHNSEIISMVLTMYSTKTVFPSDQKIV